MRQKASNWVEPFIANDRVYFKFKKFQIEAQDRDLMKYEFENQEILTQFGKYLLEYVQMQRKQRGLKL